MNNSTFNEELYQEMIQDTGCQYQNDIDEDMFNNYMQDYSS